MKQFRKQQVILKKLILMLRQKRLQVYLPLSYRNHQEERARKERPLNRQLNSLNQFRKNQKLLSLSLNLIKRMPHQKLKVQ